MPVPCNSAESASPTVREEVEEVKKDMDMTTYLATSVEATAAIDCVTGVMHMPWIVLLYRYPPPHVAKVTCSFSGNSRLRLGLEDGWVRCPRIASNKVERRRLRK